MTGTFVCVACCLQPTRTVARCVTIVFATGLRPQALLDPFEAPRNEQTRRVATAAVSKDFRVHFFDVAGGKTKDSLNSCSMRVITHRCASMVDRGPRCADRWGTTVREHPRDIRCS